MVTVFESSLFQGPDPHFGPRMKSSLRKIDVEGSLKRVPSDESDIDKLRAPQTISKSFSAGMLSDMNSQQNPMLFRSAFLKKQAEIEHVGPAKKWEAMGKGKDYLEPKNDEKLENQDSFEPIAIKETMRTPKSEFTEHVKEGDGPVSSVSEKGPSAMSLKREFKAPEEIVNLAVISKDSKLSDIHTVSGASDAMASSHSEVVAGSKHNPADEGSLSGDRTDDGNEQSVTENLPLPKNIKLEAVHIKEKEKEECASVKEIQLSRKILDESARIDQSGSLNTYQQGSLLSAVTKESENECTRSSDKQILSATPNETVNFLTDFYNDGCSFGNHDVWTTRRLCITTGTRQLRDLVDCGTNCGGTHPIEKNPSIGSADQKPDNDAALQMNKNGKTSCASVKPNDENVGITKSNGSLIEQGVKIAIVLVACGTLLFNTRQRKTK